MDHAEAATSRSLYFEDFAEGRRFQTAGRTVTESDVITFAGLSGDFSSLHMSETYAAASPFARRIAHGLCGVVITSGLFVQLGLWDDTAIAILSTAWDFKAPIYFGDTITADIRVESRRTTRHPDRGIVTFAIDAVNQDGVVVQSGTWVQMFKTRAVSSAVVASDGA